ncbi:unnamed protein product [Thlaspi arvense]|uniref:Uncharacterized protein n=1 Tax=Thlaspi arvense TaxID=13288 RepID=A0AAU9SFZ2_THLAR|nr:unnamed protein product [Thlaspi arvense]
MASLSSCSPSPLSSWNYARRLLRFFSLVSAPEIGDHEFQARCIFRDIAGSSNTSCCYDL